MSGISTSTEAVYRTCYHIDLAAKKATLTSLDKGIQPIVKCDE